MVGEAKGHGFMIRADPQSVVADGEVGGDGLYLDTELKVVGVHANLLCRGVMHDVCLGP